MAAGGVGRSCHPDAGRHRGGNTRGARASKLAGALAGEGRPGPSSDGGPWAVRPSEIVPSQLPRPHAQRPAWGAASYRTGGWGAHASIPVRVEHTRGEGGGSRPVVGPVGRPKPSHPIRRVQPPHTVEAVRRGMRQAPCLRAGCKGNHCCDCRPRYSECRSLQAAFSQTIFVALLSGCCVTAILQALYFTTIMRIFMYI